MRINRIIFIGFCFLFILISYYVSFHIIIDEISRTPNINENYNIKKNEDPKSSESNDITYSKYKNNQLKNGASPFDKYFGITREKGNAQLIVYNGAKSDAIICLYNLSKRKVIRNEYVRKNTNYTIFKIPQGRYKIKVLFGNDWNPEKVKFTGIKGYFDSDISCTEFDQEDYFKDDGHEYSIIKVTLYSVENGNATTSNINEDDFFQQ
jgi:hypothetical protein